MLAGVNVIAPERTLVQRPSQLENAASGAGLLFSLINEPLAFHSTGASFALGGVIHIGWVEARDPCGRVAPRLEGAHENQTKAPSSKAPS